MKYPRASRALRWALDPTLKRARFARTMLLCTFCSLGLSRSGAPPDQILDPPLCDFGISGFKNLLSQIISLRFAKCLYYFYLYHCSDHSPVDHPVHRYLCCIMPVVTSHNTNGRNPSDPGGFNRSVHLCTRMEIYCIQPIPKKDTRLPHELKIIFGQVGFCTHLFCHF